VLVVAAQALILQPTVELVVAVVAMAKVFTSLPLAQLLYSQLVLLVLAGPTLTVSLVVLPLSLSLA
jgi:hypothetical protein